MTVLAGLATLCPAETPQLVCLDPTGPQIPEPEILIPLPNSPTSASSRRTAPLLTPVVRAVARIPIPSVRQRRIVAGVTSLTLLRY